MAYPGGFYDLVQLAKHRAPTVEEVRQIMGPQTILVPALSLQWTLRSADKWVTAALPSSGKRHIVNDESCLRLLAAIARFHAENGIECFEEIG